MGFENHSIDNNEKPKSTIRKMILPYVLTGTLSALGGGAVVGNLVSERSDKILAMLKMKLDAEMQANKDEKELEALRKEQEARSYVIEGKPFKYLGADFTIGDKQKAVLILKVAWGGGINPSVHAINIPLDQKAGLPSEGSCKWKSRCRGNPRSEHKNC